MEPLVGRSSSCLAQLMRDLGQPEYRARQLAAWIYRKRMTDYDAMSDLPADLRRSLAERYVIRSAVSERAAASKDGATKHLVRLADGLAVECVHLPYERRVSVCLSSQVGCPVGCTFCATGMGGFARNLTAGEIVEQFLLMQDLHPNRRITHAVFMGMGEPLLNIDNVVAAAHLLRDEVQVSARNLTISTVGIVPGIRALADADLAVGLALSLHAPNDAIRDRLIPSNRRWPLAEVMAAARAYRRATGRDVTFEYLLLAGHNDSAECARELAALLGDMPGAVNLIPYNPVEGAVAYETPSSARVRAFRAELEAAGRPVTQRARRGRGASGACGQLAGEAAGRRAPKLRASVSSR
ncbi:MAG: 23S rRNA (adenine(2503)-C(2))-methyltransferase RlmN [Chthonomonadales bacterium]|nr:23S rRNA (adenine(2503)-C(2))-methyltransferase RlmN [Chthonomonadales bacterium]